MLLPSPSPPGTVDELPAHVMPAVVVASAAAFRAR